MAPLNDWEEMTEEERAESQLSLKVSLYDDFVVDVRDVFAGRLKKRINVPNPGDRNHLVLRCGILWKENRVGYSV